MAEEKKLTFDESLLKLEALVLSMEQGELSLEESIETYEKGVRLASVLNRQLKNAQLKIEELKQSSNEESVS